MVTWENTSTDRSIKSEKKTSGCVRSKLDTASFIYREEGQLAGMACIYVDDVIAAGNKTFNDKVLCGLKDAFLIGIKDRRRSIQICRNKQRAAR